MENKQPNKKEEQQEKKQHDNKQQEEKKLTEEEQKALKNLEEELISLLKEDENTKKRSLRMFFNINLHPNFLVHSLLVVLINGLTLTTIIGLTGLGKINDIGYYLGSIILFSFLESFIKVLVLKFIPKVLITSFGLVNLLYLAPLFYIVISVIGEVQFSHFYQGAIVFVLFLILRLFLTHYVKKLSYGGR